MIDMAIRRKMCIIYISLLVMEKGFEGFIFFLLKISLCCLKCVYNVGHGGRQVC